MSACNSIPENELRSLWMNYQQLKIANETQSRINSKILRSIEKNVNDNGNKPNEIYFFKKALNLDSATNRLIINLNKIKSQIYNSSATFSTEVGKKTNLDSTILNKIEYFPIELNYLVSFKIQSKSLIEIPKIEYPKLFDHNIKIIFMLLQIENMKMVVYKTERKILDEYLDFLDSSYDFDSYNLQFIFRSNQKYVEYGDTFKSYLQPYYSINAPNIESIMVDDKKIFVDSNGIGHYSTIAKSEKFDKNGLSKKNYVGKITLKLLTRDTSFMVKATYYVKKKSN